MMKKFFLLLFSLTVASFAQAQVAGRWIGTITQTGSNNVASQYYFELNLKADSAGNVSGTSYSFIRKEGGRYVLKVNIEGKENENEFIFKELNMIEYENTIQKRADYCIKSGTLQLVKENSKTFLKGSWSGIEHKTRNSCADGIILLEKMLPEPTNELVFEEEKILKLKDRTIKKGKIITVHATTLKIEIYDDAEEDGDMISLNFNGSWLVKNYKIRKRPLVRTIKINPKSPFNFIITFAHNLGKLPPNTIALVIDDGKKKQKILLKSDLETSDVIYLEFEEK